MGCGMSRSHLLDEGLGVFRNPHHTKPDTKSPKLVIENTSQSSNLHQPPVVQKINTTDDTDHHDGNNDPLWVGSPSFREYIQSVPEDNDVSTSGKEIVIGTQKGGKLICNGEVCVRRDLGGKEQADHKNDARGGRYRNLHRVTFWHGRAWHPGHPKATRKAAGA